MPRAKTTAVALSGSKKPILLPKNTPLEKAVAERVQRGIAMLDDVTPGWFEPINPATLVVSNREFCVFAQAHHEFQAGIVQVAEKALAEGKAIRTMENPKSETDFWTGRPRAKYHWLPEGKKFVDVFFYGFDVDDALKALAPRKSRRAAFGVIDKAWQIAVRQKKGFMGKPIRTLAGVVALLKDEKFKQKFGSDGDVDNYRDALLRRIQGMEEEA